jgi:hypothetical protein
MEASSTTQLHNKNIRKMLDYPFWFMQISMVIGLLLQPSFYSVIMLMTATVSGFVYIITLGKFAKEIGKNSTRWSFTTLISSLFLGPIPIWLSYMLAFDAVRESGSSSASE